MAIKEDYNHLVESIKTRYEQLAFTVSQFIITSRNNLSCGQYASFNEHKRGRIDSEITKMQGFITIRIRMLIIEELIDENNLPIAKWRWDSL